MFYCFCPSFAGESGLWPKEGHRWHGGGRDQVWGFSLLYHACGDRVVAVISGARCEILPPRAAQEKGEEIKLLHVAKNKTPCTLPYKFMKSGMEFDPTLTLLHHAGLNDCIGVCPSLDPSSD